MKRKQGDSLFDAEYSVHPQLHKRRRISDAAQGRSSRHRLTYQSLRQLDQHLEPFAPLSLLNISSTERVNDAFDPVPLRSQSSRSTVRTHSTSSSRPTDAQYRASNLFRANIYVDVELPADVGARIEQILQKPVGEEGRLSAIADKLCSKSNELVRGSAGEAEWIDAINLAMDDLRCNWMNDLTPPVHNPPPAIPRKRNRQRDSIEPSNRNTSGAAVRYPSPRASAQTTQSDPLRFPAERVEAAMVSTPIFKLKAPRPDMCVDLSDECLVEAIEPLKGRNAAKTLLADLQDNATLISNPLMTSLGLRFLFLIVEAKSGATGGNLYQAQNQAAVCGTAALRILQNLAELCVDTATASPPDRAHHAAEAALPLEHPLTFSLATEGPVHELWAHFGKPMDGEFCMACVGLWRTTAASGARDFMRHLAAILAWGTSEFKEGVVRALGSV
ncbi:hypothetical protein LTR50_006112 [Elasticomyces elasticus]|nr:hypothetical protein LTR50_006112 [Elasticomyces elasticus]